MLDEDPPELGTPEFDIWAERHEAATAARSYWRAKQAAARYRRERIRPVGGDPWPAGRR